MKIISTNIAKPKTITWQGRSVTTGIYKKPTNQPIYLSINEVRNDEVSDRIYHGGYYKACYLFSAEQYPFWKNLYPNLDWEWGMFGENLTVSNFHENEVFVGDIYKVGDAIVQVSQQREPCFKLGYKFGTQKVVKQFVERGFSGTYLSIIKEGNVAVNDEFKLTKRLTKSVSVKDLFHLILSKNKNQDLLNIAINLEAIPEKTRKLLKKHIL